MNILALDIGTSSVKAALWQGPRMGPVFRRPIPNILQDNRAEISPIALLAAVEKAIRLAADSTPRRTAGIDALSFDIFSSAVLVTDKNNKPRTPIITHADRRSVSQALAIEKKIGPARILKLAGNRPVPGGIGSTTLRWLAENTAALANNPRVSQASSFLIRHWTGQFVTDPSQAAFLGLYDITTNAWHPALARAARTPLAALPQITPADTILGRLTPAAARRLHLPAGLPVIGGLIDTSAAIIAADVPPSTKNARTAAHSWLPPGTLVHNAGSTDVLALVLANPRPGPTHLTRPLGTGAALPARWLAASTIAASGSAINWIRTTVFRDLTDPQFLAALRHACPTVKKHFAWRTSHSAFSPLSFPPLLAGDRTSITQLRATLSNLTLATTREDILAALIAGLIDASRTRFTQLSRLATVHPTIHTMGGATTIGDAMHRAWPNPARYSYRPIQGEALRGLKILAEAALNEPQA